MSAKAFKGIKGPKYGSWTYLLMFHKYHQLELIYFSHPFVQQSQPSSLLFGHLGQMAYH
jgi:hypothetical protein